MTTLAVIGSGIAGRSLIYTLAKEKKEFQKISLFGSDQFAFPCTLNSTAIVAPRGLSRGHSPLGDLLMDGFETFSNHVEMDGPQGVEEISQFTGANSKIEDFLKRYPHASKVRSFFKEETLIAEDRSYLIDPVTYTNWLLAESFKHIDIEFLSDFVLEVTEMDGKIKLKTVNGSEYFFDKVIFTGGHSNRYWKELAPESKLKSSKPIQGSYLEFNNVSLEHASFSLTLDGDNLIWNKNLKRLLIGSTSKDTHHLLAPLNELRSIYERLSQKIDLNLPGYDIGEIKVGLREKAQKREPYLFHSGNKIFLGGFYKNGFSLALKMARDLSHQYL